MAIDLNSGPLSERICLGNTRVINSSDKTSITSNEVNFLLTTVILGVLKHRKPEIIRELQSPEDDIQFGELADPYSSAKLPNRIHLEEVVFLYQKRGWFKSSRAICGGTFTW